MSYYNLMTWNIHNANPWKYELTDILTLYDIDISLLSEIYLKSCKSYHIMDDHVYTTDRTGNVGCTAAIVRSRTPTYYSTSGFR